MRRAVAVPPPPPCASHPSLLPWPHRSSPAARLDMGTCVHARAPFLWGVHHSRGQSVALRAAFTRHGTRDRRPASFNPRCCSFLCGVDEPDIKAMLDAIPLTKRSQAYETDEVRRRLAVAQGRSLTAQTYPTNGGAFIPLAQMHALGQDAHMRVTLVWDVVNAGDVANSAAYQCSYIGQTITVQSSTGSLTSVMSNFCTAQHLVTGTAGARRGELMRARSEAAAQYWEAALRVRPVQDAFIVVDPAVQAHFNVTIDPVPNTDLVIIMTARPSPRRPVAGYARCMQADQHNRCTVGWFNWVPELLDVDTPNAANTIASEMHTALHEIVHVLGGMNPGSSAANSKFIDDLGLPVEPRGNVFISETDTAYARPVTKIVTPRVLNVTRTHFGCATMNGFPLEDVPLGAGSHWEARLAGPELMSYGSGSGQVYVSDLTFAYLEDTNHYIANYSMGGKLTPDQVDEFRSSDLSFLRTSDAPSTYTPPPPHSPGALTWGRGEGCAFAQGHAKNWPAKYVCAQNQDYGCTPDNRMSAVCMVSATYN
ncbi:hypothetical protein EON62_02770, partial [archaeon]